MNRIFVALYFLSVLITTSAQELTLTPGALGGLLDDNLKQARSLILSGEADVRDFNVLAENFSNLKNLDMSNLSIAAYCEPADMGRPAKQYEADVLPDCALLGMTVQHVVLPKSLRAIGAGAFAGTAITTIEIPESTEKIGDYAFYGCASLQTVTVPGRVSEFGTYVFSECTSLASANLSAMQTDILPKYTFNNCKSLASLSLPSGIATLDDYSLCGTASLEAFTIPQSVRHIGANAMQGCGMKELLIPNSVESVDEYAFAMMPDVTYAGTQSDAVDFGVGALFGCPSLTSQSLKLTAIPDRFFAGCESLSMDAYGLLGISTVGDYGMARTATTSLDLSNSLVRLGDRAMQGMTSLKELNAYELYDNPPALGEEVFEGIDQPTVTLTVRHPEAEKIWNETPQWKEFRIVAYSGIKDADIDTSGINAWFTGKILHIRATDEIRQVRISDIDGMEIGRLSPHSTDAEFDTSELSGRVCIVVVATEKEERTFKLIR